MSNNSNIFNNNLHLDIFCYDIVESWIEYRKSKSLPYTDEDWVDWFDNDFIAAMECAFDDVIADIGEDR